MKPFITARWLGGIIALTSLCGGCRGGGEIADPVGSLRAPPVVEAAGAELGTPQSAGPFQITLSADTAVIRSGRTGFRTEVRRGGQPVTDAGVVLTLKAPGAESAGPLVTLLHEGDGQYTGAALLDMTDEWQATVTVSEAEEAWIAGYVFIVVP